MKRAIESIYDYLKTDDTLLVKKFLRKINFIRYFINYSN
jgi:hypothetical protein